jgi:hypothetical protein
MTGLNASELERVPPTRCKAFGKHIQPTEIPQKVNLPSGHTLECCGDCHMAIMNGDWSVIPEVSRL